MLDAYVALEFFIEDSMSYCERHVLSPDRLAGQIEMFQSGRRVLVASDGAGLFRGDLDSPSGGAEHLIAVADQYYLVCVGILRSEKGEARDDISSRLQDLIYQARINTAYGQLIRLRQHGLP